jgi:hypothetical protein
VIPDADILFPFLEHRGPAHSIVVALIVFAPLFVIYRKSAVPYFVALIQHPLIGDYIAGGHLQLLWPVTNQYYGLSISIRSITNITLELALFAAATVIMLKNKNILAIMKPHASNLLLSIPIFTVLLPTILSFPLNVPALLLLPHVVYTVIFSTSVVRYLLAANPKTQTKTQTS